MAINPIGKTKTMRPSLIDVIDKINETITVVNNLNSNDYQGEIDSINTKIGTINTQIQNANTNISNAQADITLLESDVNNIKETLYTPLSENVPDPS